VSRLYEREKTSPEKKKKKKEEEKKKKKKIKGREREKKKREKEPGKEPTRQQYWLWQMLSPNFTLLITNWSYLHYL